MSRIANNRLYFASTQGVALPPSRSAGSISTATLDSIVEAWTNGRLAPAAAIFLSSLQEQARQQGVSDVSPRAVVRWLPQSVGTLLLAEPVAAATEQATESINTVAPERHPDDPTPQQPTDSQDAQRSRNGRALHGHELNRQLDKLFNAFARALGMKALSTEALKEDDAQRRSVVRQRERKQINHATARRRAQAARTTARHIQHNSRGGRPGLAQLRAVVLAAALATQAFAVPADDFNAPIQQVGQGGHGTPETKACGLTTPGAPSLLARYADLHPTALQPPALPAYLTTF